MRPLLHTIGVIMLKPLHQYKESEFIDRNELIELANLSGMIFHNDKYTPTEWEAKTGVNPLKFLGLIKISPPNNFHPELSGNRCIWTNEAEILCKFYFRRVKIEYARLGL